MNTEKRRELERRVNQCINLCISDWMDWAISTQSFGDCGSGCPVDIDDIPASRQCDDCKGTGWQLCDGGECSDTDCECWLAAGTDGERHTVTDSECAQCDGGEIAIEIMEWWHVDKWLGGQLADRGEVVLEGEIWGRETSGQAICLDSVMEEIFQIHP